MAVQRRCLPHSSFCNIGGDETIDLGQGRSAAVVEQRGYASVYATRLAWLLSQAQDRGWTPMYWADIALEHSAALDHLPSDAVALGLGL